MPGLKVTVTPYSKYNCPPEVFVGPQEFREGTDTSYVR